MSLDIFSNKEGGEIKRLDLDGNRINSVLLEFREILLALSHKDKILRSALILKQSDVIVFSN